MQSTWSCRWIEGINASQLGQRLTSFLCSSEIAAEAVRRHQMVGKQSWYSHSPIPCLAHPPRLHPVVMPLARLGWSVLQSCEYRRLHPVGQRIPPGASASYNDTFRILPARSSTAQSPMLLSPRRPQAPAEAEPAVFPPAPPVAAPPVRGRPLEEILRPRRCTRDVYPRSTSSCARASTICWVASRSDLVAPPPLPGLLTDEACCPSVGIAV